MLPWVEWSGSGVLGGKIRRKAGGYLIRVVIKIIGDHPPAFAVDLDEKIETYIQCRTNIFQSEANTTGLTIFISGAITKFI